MPDDSCGSGNGGDGTKTNRPTRGETSLDDAFDVLANHRRRYALYYLQTASDGACSITDLADYLVAHDPDVDDRDSVAVALHHQDVPKMEDVGLLEYDTRSETVRYRGSRTVEELLSTVIEVETE